MPKLTIEYDDSLLTTKVFVDEKQLGCVQRLSFKASASGHGELLIEFPAEFRGFTGPSFLMESVRAARSVLGASVFGPCPCCDCGTWQNEHDLDECVVFQVMES